jgi:hypothetical protein
LHPETRVGAPIPWTSRNSAALATCRRSSVHYDQGLVLGIAGAGNVGTALSTFLGSWVASSWGWHSAFGIALVPVLVTLAMVALLAKDSATHRAPKSLADYTAVLLIAETGWFCVFYAITFGGFVGLVSFLGIFFRDQYALTQVRAGALVTLCALTGSMFRRLGGYLSDRFGGIRVLTWLYLGIAGTMAGMSALPPLGPSTLLLVTGLTLLGMGNGAVFQLVAQRFPGEIGVITGLVGTAGGGRGVRAAERPWKHEAIDAELRRRLPGVRAGGSSGRGRRVLGRQNLGGHVFGQARGRAGPANAGKRPIALSLRGANTPCSLAQHPRQGRPRQIQSR